MNLKQSIVETTSKVSMHVCRKAPELLAGTGIACFIASTFMAVKVTPKANDILEEKKQELQTEDLPIKETVKAVGKLYLPAVISGTAGICFVAASVSESNKRYLALSTSYELIREAANTYKEKVIETIGERKEKKIRDEIAQDKVDANPPTDNTIILTNNGNTLMRDGLTGQYFRYDIDKFKQKTIELANEELNEGYTGVPDWLMTLGLNIPDTLIGMGWSIADQGKAVTVDYHAVVAHQYNDEPCLVIEYDPMPISDFNIFYK